MEDRPLRADPTFLDLLIRRSNNLLLRRQNTFCQSIFQHLFVKLVFQPPAQEAKKISGRCTYIGDDDDEKPPDEKIRILEKVDLPNRDEEEDDWNEDFEPCEHVRTLQAIFDTNKLFCRTSWGLLILAINKIMCFTFSKSC